MFTRNMVVLLGKSFMALLGMQSLPGAFFNR